MCKCMRVGVCVMRECLCLYEYVFSFLLVKFKKFPGITMLLNLIFFFRKVYGTLKIVITPKEKLCGGVKTRARGDEMMLCRLYLS